MDSVSKERRSEIMGLVMAKNTRPEIFVRRLFHRLGYRYRLHRKDLPGRPDIVLPKYHTVIFVHGCFWHCHDCRWGSVIPKTRAEFWSVKRQGNVDRDQRRLAELESAGWKVIIIWECEARNTEAL